MPTPEEKLLGKKLIAEWLPEGGDPVDDLITLTVYSRSFSVKQAAKDIDVTTRADVLAGEEDLLSGVPNRDITMGGLDSDVNAPDYDLIELGDKGTLTWYRRLKTTGMPKKSMLARLTGTDFGSPHDNANDWSLAFKGLSVITTGTVA